MKAKFSEADIKKVTDAFLKKTDKEIYTILDYEGRDYVNRCKEGGSYKNRTGNLRNSIGYMVCLDGQILGKYQEGGDAETQEQCLAYADELAKQYNQGWYLIVYAGKHYALYVELKGYSVLTSFMPGREEFYRTLSNYISHE